MGSTCVGVLPNNKIEQTREVVASHTLLSMKQQEFLGRHSVRLFLISFLVLFMELVCIRWLSAYVLYLGYFTNFVLLGALLGIGVGTQLVDRKAHLIEWFPPLLFLLVVLALFTRAQVQPDFEGLLFFTSSTSALRLPPAILLPTVFISVSTLFVLLSQELGRLLNEFEPLRAYSLNIVGSLAGILGFSLLSFASAPSWTWYLVAALLVIPYLPSGSKRGRNLLLLGGTVLTVAASDFSFGNFWSPYSRLNLLRQGPVGTQRVMIGKEDPLPTTYFLYANGAGHQEFYAREEMRPFYLLPYQVVGEGSGAERVLVVGAGGGNDIAAALRNGVARVDAVEIDRRIVDLGRRYHPESPYRDPRVNVYVADARAFLRRSADKYDMIIFALPDSLVLASSMSSVRLESYLFTLESFESVRAHLKPNGLFVLYNYYRFDWLTEKIASMLSEVFGEAPLYHQYSDLEYLNLGFATFFAGPGTDRINTQSANLSRLTSVSQVPATDDWPFLYMKDRSLPPQYSAIFVMILIVSFIYLRKFSAGGGISLEGWPYFLMGAAFMLLEAKSIVSCFLLFGATWFVNALVFFAVLLAVLVANWMVAKFRIAHLGGLYLVLFGALSLNLILPLENILIENVILRYGVAAVLLFSPIFLANLIYGAIFRRTRQANIAFSANLLGTMVGGSLEYLALVLGYHSLVLLAALFYLAAFALVTRRKAEPAQSAAT